MIHWFALVFHLLPNIPKQMQMESFKLAVSSNAKSTNIFGNELILFTRDIN